MTKISKLSSPNSFFFQAQNAPKSVFGRPRPRWGELTTLPRPLVGWGGDTPSPFPSPIDAFGVSVLRPPQHKILATPVITVAKVFKTTNIEL